MRGYKNTPTVGYINWVVDYEPDFNGTYSGVSPGDLEAITINKVVDTPTINFIRPSNVTDGYFIHLGSYDQLNPTPPGPPITIPTQKSGVAIVRGSADGSTPNDYAVFAWDPAETIFKLYYATNGDYNTIGNSLSLKLSNVHSDGYVSIGTSLPTTGKIRLSNNSAIYGRTSGGSNTKMLELDSSDRINIGDTNTESIRFTTKVAGKFNFFDGTRNYLSILQEGLTFNQDFDDIAINIASTSTHDGYSLSIAAQNATGAGSTGGDLILSSGNGVLNPGGIRLVRNSIISIYVDDNISFFDVPTFNGEIGVLYIKECTVAPTAAPSGGGMLYVEHGALKYIGTSGTITTLGPA